jgi:glutamate synthase domain-containing protein 3
MSGGIAYVADGSGELASRCNPDMVDLRELEESDDEQVRAMLRRHYRATESPLAFALLANWAASRRRFVKVQPKIEAPLPARDDMSVSRSAASRR